MGLRSTMSSLMLGCLLLTAASGCRTAAMKNTSGVALHQQGRYDEAIGNFQEALSHDPTNADTYYNLASSYHNKGKVTGDGQLLAQAEQLYNQALDISPDHPQCHRGLACLLVDTERPDKAFTLMQRWNARSPQVIDSHIELARLYEEFGDKDSAIAHLEQAVAVNANNASAARAWSALASLREQTGNPQQALQNYYRSQQSNPYQPAVTERIAALQRSLGGPPS